MTLMEKLERVVQLKRDLLDAMHATEEDGVVWCEDRLKMQSYTGIDKIAELTEDGLRLDGKDYNGEPERAYVNFGGIEIVEVLE